MTGAQGTSAARSAESAPPATRFAELTSYDVADFAVPTARDEDWRFTPLKRLVGLHDGTFEAEKAPLSRETGELPAGVRAESVGRDDQRVGSALVPFDRVSAQAYTSFSEAYVLSVDANAVVETPVVVNVRGGSADGASFGHTVVDIGQSAEATVVLDHTGSAVLADNVEILVGDNAKLVLVTVQDFDPGSVHVQHQRVRLGRDARIVHVSVSLGGDLVRQFTSVDYSGRGGEADVYGIYFADGGQHLEHRQLVDHSVPDCRSNVLYRGALQGVDAHTVWIGDVLIRPDATGTDTYEINRNLVLTEGARADSVPNLEIQTGDVVGAGHASATGRFDDEQLFYLMSRGITAENARRLVVRGFFAELINKIPVESLRERITATVEARLSEAGA
ncbi:Fe-S cluster assembly protein SufD [Fodinicola acaciae]|uniref:Fe-S cluster assembly protein SufD n=1 Tax=Fodinicola acaciae TaxID=2681555 RepID=UPI0013D69AE6|nr:Fe-S cluster assembly protein SufD [Fodinicola acaciae]